MAEWGAWAAALVVAALVLAATHYGTRDADSRVYSRIAAQLAERPASAWIAPEWPPGGYAQGPFREHPVGLFVPAALLGSLGYPALQAGYALNGVYQALTLALLPSLAAAVTGPLQARSLAWILQLLPVAFVYRVRANHEPVLLLLLVLALIGTERARGSVRWSALTAVALSGMLLVKGVFALFGLLACGLWLLLRGTGDGGRRRRLAPWLGLVFAVVLLGLAVVAYESGYRSVSGQSFLAFYAGRWLSGAHAPQGLAAGDAAYSLAFYLGRLTWFAAPWSLVAVAALVALVARRVRGGTEAALRHSPGRQGALFVLLLSLAYVFAFSAGDHRAERYIFPAYYAVGACGAVLAVERSTRWRQFVVRADRVAFLPVALWCLLFSLHLVAGRLNLPNLRLWGPW